MSPGPVVAAVVVAAGASRRFGGSRPKVLTAWRGRPLLAWTLRAFEAAATVRDVILVAPEDVARGLGAEFFSKLRATVPGGAERQDSVAAGLQALDSDVDVVLVHDGARPFVRPALVDLVAVAAAGAGGAVPLLPVVDTIKSVEPAGSPRAGRVASTVDRDTLRRAQTPQGFRTDVLRAALAHAQSLGGLHTDDCGMVERALQDGALRGDVEILGVPGEESNVKITQASDLPQGGQGLRVGLGHDVHPLVPGRPFILAGVDVGAGEPPPGRGPAGHSDGDALTHATCDALLGAAGLSDIGTHFPDTDVRHQGQPSLEFLAAVRVLLEERGLRVVNISAVLHLERPKLLPHVPRLRAALAEALGVSVDVVGLSAKRGEGLGPVGEGLAIACDVVALVSA